MNINVKNTLKYKCNMLIMDIMEVERNLIKLHQHPEITSLATNKYSGETKAGVQSSIIVLACRCLEDACSRIGKII